jgi:predicted SAM-dependent methyltransferase
MHELSKSIQRRLHDSNFVTRYFTGEGIDIGAGPDPLNQYFELFPLMTKVRAWDINDGDAEFMNGCDDAQYDFVHSSHCLEHIRNPEIALKNWLRILKPGGHLIVMVPDEDMYEQGVFPSTFNSDHKWTFAVFKTASWSRRSRNLLDLITTLGEGADLIKIEQLTGSYRFSLPRQDQTQTPIGESAIEFIIRKRTKTEIEAGGCLVGARRFRIRRPQPTNQALFDNLNRIRDARIAGTTAEFPHSVVIPEATYSPWNENPSFRAAYDAIKTHTLVDIYRCYDLWCLIRQAASIPGDVLEVGVWRGGTACLLGLAMKEAKVDGRLYLADTFAGVVNAGQVDPIYKGGEHADTTLPTVKSLLATNGIDNYSILQGIFPEQTAVQIDAGPIRFCHVDVDVYQSAKDTFDWVWPRLSIGGMVVFDDYGFPNCSGVTKFVNEQVGRNDLIFVYNLNGHALLIKTK